MPTRSPHPCSQPGCPALVASGRFCDEHRHEQQARQDAERGTVAQRGYGARWQQLRRMALAAQPLCADPDGFHRQHGEVVAATDVDHIIPKSRGGQDTLDNLQCLCHQHHSRKTATEDGGYGHK